MKNGLFITLGANVGTCVTALIGIIGTNKNSKRVAVIHLIFNISGRLLFPPILLIFGGPFGSILETLVSRKEIQIAIFHFFSM
jgi:phosphate:Na+ symporter